MRNVMPPMHQVNRMRTACRRTFDGCRCNHRLPDTIRIRLRGVSSYPWRKMDCQTCDSVIWRFVSSHMPMIATRSSRATLSDAEKSARLFPVATLEAIRNAHVDDELTIVGHHHPVPLERPWRRPLEVDPGLAEATAVAWALELLFNLQPARGTPEMSALGKQGIKPICFADDPHPVFLLVLLADLTDRVVAR